MFTDKYKSYFLFLCSRDTVSMLIIEILPPLCFQVGMLRQQVEEHEKVKQEMAVEYKQELKKLHEEVRF